MEVSIPQGVNMSEHIGDRIAQLRRALRYSQTEFGERVGVTQTTVSDWETHKTTPTLGNVRLMSDLAGDTREVFGWLKEGGETPRLSQVPSRAVQTIAQESHRASRIVGTPKATAHLLERLRSIQRESAEILDALEELVGQV